MPQGLELRSGWLLNVRSPVLGSGFSLGCDRQPNICSVKLLFNNDFARQEFLALHFREDLVVAKYPSRRAKEMRGARKLEELLGR
jgi:hypothetical protein